VAARHKEVLFLLFIFVFLTAWAIVLPYNGAPDEGMRYDIPYFIYQHGTLPHGGDASIRNPIWGVSYGFYPVLSYMISAGLMKIASFFSESKDVLVIAARMTSVVFTAGTAFFSVKIGKKAFPKSGNWLFVILTTLLPGTLFIGSYVNCDAMAVFSAAWIVYLWMRGIETNWNYKICVGLAAAMSICLLSYYNAYGFLLCSFLLFTASMLLFQERKWDWKQLFSKGIFILLLVAVFAGWWFVRNYIIYDGDILGMRTSNFYGDLYAQPEFKPSLHSTPYKEGMSLPGMLLRWMPKVFVSFVGVFGYLNVYLPIWMYLFYFLVFSAGALGCLLKLKELFALREDKHWRIKGFFNWTMLLAMIIPNALNLYHSYCVDYQAQGRYSLPMLIPFMYFVVFGLLALTQKLMKTEKVQKRVFIVTKLLILGIAGYSFLQIL